MKIRWRKLAVIAAIAFPTAFLIRWVAPQLGPEVACVWQADGEVWQGTDEQCRNLPDGAVIFTSGEKKP